MNIPPVIPIPSFRPGERHEGAADQRRNARDKDRKGADRRGALTGNLPSREYDPADRDDRSDLGRVTDQTV